MLGLLNTRSYPKMFLLFLILKIRFGFNLKYKGWYLWNPKHVSKTSWFYKSICNTTNFIRFNINLLSCNPLKVDIWFDPYFFYLPLAKKPTFINMLLEKLEELSFIEIINSNGFYKVTLKNMFGNSLDWNQIEKVNLNEEGNNLWVRRHPSYRAFIASTIYDHAIDFKSFEEPWLGWPIIWKLPMIIKFFLWKLAHARLSTKDYLYHLNIDPKNYLSLLWSCG